MLLSKLLSITGRREVRGAEHGLFCRLRQASGDEIIGRIQVVLARLVNHTKLLMLGSTVVWNHLVHFSQSQRRSVLLVLNANDELWFYPPHFCHPEYA